MISIVTCSADPARAELFQSHIEHVFEGADYELILIRDAQSLTSGYNRGLMEPKGDVIVFCHDDIEFLGADVPRRIEKHAQTFDAFGVAGTDLLIGPSWISAGPPHIFGHVAHPLPNKGGYHVMISGVTGLVTPGIQALDGLFLAFRRPVIDAIGWDEATFDAWHLYDVDTTFRAHLAGYKLAVVNDIPILHDSPGSYGGQWMEQATKFNAKFKGQLPSFPARKSGSGYVQVRTKAEALEVMSPAWLDMP